MDGLQFPGPKPKLDDVQQANLLQALRGPAPDGGLWNGRIVADYLSELIGERISRQQGWEYLSSDAVTAANPSAIASVG